MARIILITSFFAAVLIGQVLIFKARPSMNAAELSGSDEEGDF